MKIHNLQIYTLHHLMGKHHYQLSHLNGQLEFEDILKAVLNYK